MQKNKVIADFTEIALEYKRDLIDLVAFDILTQEEHLPNLIAMCNTIKTSRYDLIDLLKEEMVAELEESDLYDRDKELRELIELDIDLIQIEALTKRLTLKNKKLILFNISKVYEVLMKLIFSRANFETNGLLANSLDDVFRGNCGYEEYFNSK